MRIGRSTGSSWRPGSARTSSMTRELRLELDPWLESVKALGPLIDPNLHSCGSVPPHGHRELSHPEPGFYTIGVKSYGRAPTFLLLTGYEQARSVAAAIAGDWRPPTTCSSCCRRPASARPTPSRTDAGCCGGPAPAEVGCLLRRRRRGEGGGQAGCGCGPDARERRARAMPAARRGPAAGRAVIVPVLGVTQILAWGSSYYLPAVLAQPIAADTGWPLTWVVGGLSLGLLVAGLVSPRVGRQIDRHGGRPVLAASAAPAGGGPAAAWPLAPNLPVYLAAWLVIGLGMGAGLYDAAFATLGRLYGQEARAARSPR